MMHASVPDLPVSTETLNTLEVASACTACSTNLKSYDVVFIFILFGIIIYVLASKRLHENKIFDFW